MNTNKIIDKIKYIKKFKSDKDIAELLGISPTNFNNRKKRGTLIPLITEWGIHEKVDLNWLLKGDESVYKTSPNNQQINLDILTEVIKSVEEGLNINDLYLPPDKKAQLISLLYEYFTEEDEENNEIDQGTVIKFLRLAT
ncbi:HTH araC/xylS-type domain-containing protein [Candidatus Magnetomoraceae bacterium gMMP-15]